MNANMCADCASWDEDAYGAWGDCCRIENWCDVEKPDGKQAAAKTDHWSNGLKTQAGFGCVLHRVKE